MHTHYDTDVLRWIDLTGESSLPQIEKQIDAARASLLHQIDTLAVTLAHSRLGEERDLRHLATVVEHTAHLMHETVDLLQVRRVLKAAANLITLRIAGMELRIV